MASRVVTISLSLSLVLPACSASHTIDFDAGGGAVDAFLGSRDGGPRPIDSGGPGRPDSGPRPPDSGPPVDTGPGRCGELFRPYDMPRYGVKAHPQLGKARARRPRPRSAPTP